MCRPEPQPVVAKGLILEMPSDHSIHFFDQQFQRQSADGELALNPFEAAALPYVRGSVLDFGCGLGNLAVAAARRGCRVTALDGSATAISHLQRRAAAESLDIHATQADLRSFELEGNFDTVVSIGLLMFFDCATAARCLARLQSHLREGGFAIINVMIEGTTYLDMCAPGEHCLFRRTALEEAFTSWGFRHSTFREFAMPDGRIKAFTTLVAQKPVSRRIEQPDITAGS
jgi:tellurite methyltransferase